MSKIKLNFKINVFNNDIDDPKNEPLIYTYCFEDEVDGDNKFIDYIKKLAQKYSGKEKNSILFVNDNELFWGKYFDIEIYRYLKYDVNMNPNDYNIKIEGLEKQFHLSENEIEFNVNGPGIGGDVGRMNGIRFYFHTNEKDIHVGTPHIHVKKGLEEYRVNLKDKKPMDKVFKNKHDNKIVNEFIDEFQEQLLDYWNRVVINGESLKIKLTLQR